MNKKRYDVPQEIIKIKLESNAYRRLMKVYAALPFGYNKAAKCACEAEYLDYLFWIKLRILYPELEKDHIKWEFGDNCMFVYDK